MALAKPLFSRATALLLLSRYPSTDRRLSPAYFEALVRFESLHSPSRRRRHRLRMKNIAQIGYFVYCLVPPEKTIDAEPRLEAASDANRKTKHNANITQNEYEPSPTRTVQRIPGSR